MNVPEDVKEQVRKLYNDIAKQQADIQIDMLERIYKAMPDNLPLDKASDIAKTILNDAGSFTLSAVKQMADNTDSILKDKEKMASILKQQEGNNDK